MTLSLPPLPAVELEALMLAEAGVLVPFPRSPPKLNLLNAFEASNAGVLVYDAELGAGVRVPETEVHDCSRYVTLLEELS
jgi:hypothetical protein